MIDAMALISYNFPMENKVPNRDRITTVLKNNPLGMSSSEISRATGLLKRTVQRILKNLVKLNVISKNGVAKNTTYRLREQLLVTYHADFLDKLIDSKIFTKDEFKKIELLGKRTGDTIDLETYNSKIFERLIIDLSWSSSYLEGNTYSLLETEQLILKNIEANDKDLIETQMILNHKEAIKFITFNKKSIEIDSYTVKSVHALLSENLISNPNAQGSLRKIPVGIEGTRYLPLDIPQKIESEFDRLLRRTNESKNPVLRSFILFVYLPYLQPFEDLNKRTARVCCNIPLLKDNYIPISFLNVERKEYIRALKAIYEFNDITEMKTIFLKAYQFSVEKYRYIKQKVRTPNKLELKFRTEIRESVRNCVKNNIRPDKLAFPNLSKTESKELKQIIFNELKTLHEENLIRFDLRVSDYKKWKRSQD